jgi:hypothetical protein
MSQLLGCFEHLQISSLTMVTSVWGTENIHSGINQGRRRMIEQAHGWHALYHRWYSYLGQNKISRIIYFSDCVDVDLEGNITIDFIDRKVVKTLSFFSKTGRTNYLG